MSVRWISRSADEPSPMRLPPAHAGVGADEKGGARRVRLAMAEALATAEEASAVIVMVSL